MNKTDKPLSEWTLDEAKAECRRRTPTDRRGCAGCPLNGTVCEISGEGIDLNSPDGWAFGDVEDHSERDAAADDALIATEVDRNTNAPVKPRLAEVLEVEVEERFTFRDGEKEIPGLFIWKDGCLYDSTYQTAYAALVCACINHPESIIRAPRLTEPEIAIMRAVGAKWVSMDVCGSKRIELWKEMPHKTEDGAFFSSVGNGSLAIVRESLFPSLKPGNCIEYKETEYDY